MGGQSVEGTGIRTARLTISSVQTLLIQTFSLPSTPRTLSSSTPSHQQRRAGFRQKRSSFCAIPTALLLAASLPLMSVRRRASAMLQMTALLGSPARWPQWSSWLKPLRGSALVYVHAARYSPCGQHLNEMLLGRARLLALAQTREDALLLQQRLASSALDLDHLGLGDVAVRRDDVKVQVLA